jgi:hypothetical protein
MLSQQEPIVLTNNAGHQTESADPVGQLRDKKK